jgi:hypothetical protein
LLFLACLFLIFTLSCGSKEEYAGTYFVQKAVSPKHYVAVIELKEDGQGVWRVFEEEVSFRWSVRGNEIRVHTKEGGIIIGKIQGDVIEITLPGAKSMSFKKRQPS